MPAPTSTPTGCPPGLEYLTQVDQILVNQQIELIECVCEMFSEIHSGHENDIHQLNKQCFHFAPLYTNTIIQ